MSRPAKQTPNKKKQDEKAKANELLDKVTNQLNGDLQKDLLVTNPADLSNTLVQDDPAYLSNAPTQENPAPTPEVIGTLESTLDEPIEPLYKIYDHIVKANGKFYDAGEKVPV